jgi:hypothetical protein
MRYSTVYNHHINESIRPGKDVESIGLANGNATERNRPLFIKDPFGPPRRSQAIRSPVLVVPECQISWASRVQQQIMTPSSATAATWQLVEPSCCPMPHIPQFSLKRAFQQSENGLPSARSVLGHEMILPIRNTKRFGPLVSGTRSTIPFEREDVSEAADILSTFHLEPSRSA